MLGKEFKIAKIKPKYYAVICYSIKGYIYTYIYIYYLSVFIAYGYLIINFRNKRIIDIKFTIKWA